MIEPHGRLRLSLTHAQIVAPLGLLGALCYNHHRGMLQVVKHRKRWGMLFEVRASCLLPRPDRSSFLFTSM